MKRSIISLDIGATKTLIGKVTGHRVSDLQRFPTSDLFAENGDVEALVTQIEKQWRPTITGLAIGFAGPVEKGIIRSAPNFSDVVFPRPLPLQRLLERRFKVPVLVANDAECFAVGEAVHGAGRRRHRVIGLTLGTGVGGGIVIDGKSYRGPHHLAGEFGHLPFPTATGRCGCGKVGHLETVLSGPGLSRLYEMATGHHEQSATIIRAARKGDPAAKHALEHMSEALVHLLLTVLLTWDPDIIVIGGGLALIPKLIVQARHNVRAQVPFPALRRVPIVPSLLHDKAILLGAAHLL